jgi:hypothetical protein
VVNAAANMTLIEKCAWIVAADRIEGDYFEFGVFRGGAFINSYKALEGIFEQKRRGDIEYNTATPEGLRALKATWDRMRFFAFDSFEGLPALEGVDRHEEAFAEGQYAAGADEFRANLAAAGVPLDRVTCVPGWFEQTCIPATIEKYGLTKAAVIWVDCDLYHSTVSVLNFITPLLQDGTILIFDDWYCFRGNPRRGEQRAFAEWRQTLRGFTVSEYQKEGPWRVAFLVSEDVAD